MDSFTKRILASSGRVAGRLRRLSAIVSGSIVSASLDAEGLGGAEYPPARTVSAGLIPARTKDTHRDAHGRSRSALHQHHPDPGHGRRPAGQLRPSGDADGHGARGLRAVAAAPALRPERPHLAEPRPVRSLDGPRLHVALLAAAPGG